ncbi:glycosyltransferase [Candidatus Fermentibacterales bacterium]|nr:glycosyltransferase [Candidatus Fermentibacterales bacterium]
MRVLEVYKDISPWVRGGIERYVSELGRFLRDAGHDVCFLVARRRPGLRPGRTELEGMQVFEAPTLFRALSNPFCPGFGAMMLARRPDVVHVHLPLPTAVISSLVWGGALPTVVTYHSDIVRQRFVMPLYRPFLLRFLRRARAVLATSPTYVETSKVLSRLANVEPIPIGVDTGKWHPPETRDERDHVSLTRRRLGEEDYFLFVGRFRSYKGIDVLLDAWRALGDKRLVMVGNGPLREHVMKRTETEGLRVTIELDVEDAELAALYRGARALILPSTERSEAYGMVILEAMASGVPVVSSDLETGVSWLNEHEATGLVFRRGDPSALAEAVRRMMGEERDVYAANALSKARGGFSQSVLFDRVMRVLERSAGVARPSG